MLLAAADVTDALKEDDYKLQKRTAMSHVGGRVKIRTQVGRRSCVSRGGREGASESLVQLSKTCTFPDCVGGESEMGSSLSQASSVTSQRNSQVINLMPSLSQYPLVVFRACCFAQSD